ncbi:MAG: SRPBCC family protein [Actinomycetota bacterium]|nr:SRPBCC family protein [Actinomycetota bacterium]
MAEQTESSIAITAPPDAVMAVIADLETYPEWNDEVKTVEVVSRHAGPEQRPREVRFVLDAGTIRDDYTLAYEWAPDSVRWSLVEGQMLKAMDGSYTLRVGADGTEATYRLAVDVKIPMIGLIKRKAEKVIIDRALKGLKKRVESRAGA